MVIPILYDLSFSHTFPEIQNSPVVPKDCSDIRALGYSTSGVYQVHVGLYQGSLAEPIQVDVYCDMTTPCGNWLVSVTP